MRMISIPDQSSVAKAFEEFDAAGRMRQSAYYDRIVDVMEELVRITVLMRPPRRPAHRPLLGRKQAKTPIDTTKDLSAIAVAQPVESS